MCAVCAVESIAAEDDDGFKDFMVDELYVPEYQQAVRKDKESCTLGYRYPIWFSACSYQKLNHKVAAPGLKEKQSDFVKLGSLPENNPDLQYLPDSLVKYLQNFKYKSLGLEVRNFCVPCVTCVLDMCCV